MKKMLFLGVIFLLLFSFFVGVTSFSDLQKSLSAYSDKLDNLSSSFMNVFSSAIRYIGFISSPVTITEEDKESFKKDDGTYDVENYYRQIFLNYYDQTYEVRTIVKFDASASDRPSDEIVIYSTCPFIPVESSVSFVFLRIRFDCVSSSGEHQFYDWWVWNYNSNINTGFGIVPPSV